METARALYSQSLAEFRALNDPWGVAGTLADLGNLALDNNDYAAARDNTERVCRFSRNSDRNVEWRVCSNVLHTRRRPEGIPNVRCAWPERRLRFANP